MSLLKPKHTPIGIEISAHALRAVQLQRRGSAWSILDQVTTTRADPTVTFGVREAQQLADVLHRRSFVGRRAVVSLPNGDMIRGLFEAEDKNANDPFLTIAQDIERTHNLEPGSYELAAWLPPASGARRKAAVCVAGCTHATAQNLITAFEAINYEVAAIDSRACALGRLVDSPAKRVTAVLDIEHDSAELVLINAGSVVYQRPLIDAGLGQIHRRLLDQGLGGEAADHCLKTIGLGAIQNRQGQLIRDALLGFVQHVAQEARPALDYAARVYSEMPIGQFTLVGSAAQVPLLEYELRQQLGFDAAALECPVYLDAEIDPCFAVGLGLALHPQEVAWTAA